MPKKKKTTKKTAPRRKSVPSAEKKAIEANKQALWKTYHDLHNKAEALMAKIREDMKNGTIEQTRQDANELLLIMGECNYMAQECKKMQSRRK